MIDTGNQRAVNNRAKALKQKQSAADDGLRTILSQESSRAYLVEMIRDSQALLNVVAAGEQGAMFREGRRIVGLKIMADVQRVAPKQFASLIAGVLDQPRDEEENNGDRTDPDTE